MHVYLKRQTLTNKHFSRENSEIHASQSYFIMLKLILKKTKLPIIELRPVISGHGMDVILLFRRSYSLWVILIF